MPPVVPEYFVVSYFQVRNSRLFHLLMLIGNPLLATFRELPEFIKFSVEARRMKFHQPQSMGIHQRVPVQGRTQFRAKMKMALMKQSRSSCLPVVLSTWEGESTLSVAGHEDQFDRLRYDPKDGQVECLIQCFACVRPKSDFNGEGSHSVKTLVDGICVNQRLKSSQPAVVTPSEYRFDR